MRSPLAIDLFCGLGGWTEGLLAEGYDVVGFDIEQHVYGEHRYPAQLVVQDVLTLHGSQFRNATLIVASPPCQEYSYMAMPWTRAKQIAREYRDGTRDRKKLTALFDACFRIQREACEAAGRHIPLVVENVRGAQRWVGRARWNYGSFYLWGDVPALMPPVRRAAKVPGLNWNGYKNGDPNYKGQAFNPAAQGRALREDLARKTAGHPNIRDGFDHIRHLTNPAEHGRKHQGDWFRDPSSPTRQGGQKGRKYDVPGDGIKQPGINLSAVGFNVANAQQFASMVEGVKIKRSADDKRQHIGVTRKFASAMIAKIPLPLSRHIARTFLPMTEAA